MQTTSTHPAVTAHPISMSNLHFEVVESKSYPGWYCATAWNSEGDGEPVTVEFLHSSSKEMAEEYAAWKNSQAQPETSTRMSSTHR